MKRMLLITVALLLGLCVLCVALGYYVALPRAQDEVEEQVEEAIGTYVAPHIAGIGATPTAGTHVLSEDEVNAEIQTGNPDLEDLRFEITPAGIELRFGQQGQDVSYTASVSAENGQLVVSDAQVDGLPSLLLPVDTISDGVEKGINSYLGANNLVVSSVTLSDGEMTVVLDDAQ